MMRFFIKIVILSKRYNSFFMKKIFTLLTLQIFVFHFANAQFADDFNDGDFTKNPTWSWQTDSFIVNAKQELQLNAKTGGNSRIAVNYTCEQAMIWEFLVRMEFAPSATNRTIIYLTANPLQTTTITNGYYLLMGEDGTTDKIKLFKAGETTPLATCQNTFILNNLVNTRVRVKRGANNLWTIEADYNGGYAFTQEATAQEQNPFPLIANTSFAFWCDYTATRKDKFFFDDIKVSKNEPDKTAPFVTAVIPDPVIVNKFTVKFSEVVDSISAKDPSAYGLKDPAGSLISLTYNYDKVTLEYAQMIPNNNYLLLVFPGIIKDLAGNLMGGQSQSFKTATLASTTIFNDVIINEIFADPSPQIGLPKAEFIELYNRSTKTINLQGFSLKDKGTTQYKLPKFTLQPNAYVIIYKRDKAIDFGKYGDTIAVTTFFTLDSDNEEITLFNEKNELMDKVSYSLGTYQDVKKSDGGWSLECINPNTPCLGGYNFRASENENGGTPGKINSVFSKEIEKSPLLLTYVFPTNDSEILVQFNKNLDFSTLQNAVFDIETGINTVVQGANFQEAKITLNSAMQKGKIYTLKIKKALEDCVGNAFSETEVKIGVPETVAAKDVVINEILFNPKTGGTDFVEIYNRSKKIINLNELNIDNRQKLDVQEINVNYLLLPNEYAVLTESKSILQAQGYTIKNPNAIVETKLPSFDDDEGNVTLIKADAPGKLIIDAADYDKSYHYPLLKDQSGVSLERINPDGESNNKSNWYSAASTAGFATPTYQNSQFLIAQKADNELFSLENTRFSPDGDGFEDLLFIQYKNTLTGLTASAKVFDLDGRLIKNIAGSELLANEGALRWDGDTEDGTKALIGIYVVFVQYFTPDGTTGNWKKTVSLVGKL